MSEPRVQKHPSCFSDVWKLLTAALYHSKHAPGCKTEHLDCGQNILDVDFYFIFFGGGGSTPDSVLDILHINRQHRLQTFPTSRLHQRGPS